MRSYRIFEICQHDSRMGESTVRDGAGKDGAGSVYGRNRKVTFHDVKSLRFPSGRRDTKIPEKESMGTCPVCGSLVYEGKKNFYCGNRECNFCLWKENKYLQSMEKDMDARMAAELLKNGSVRVKDLYSRKKTCILKQTCIWTLMKRGE